MVSRKLNKRKYRLNKKNTIIRNEINSIGGMNKDSGNSSSSKSKKNLSARKCSSSDLRESVRERLRKSMTEKYMRANKRTLLGDAERWAKQYLEEPEGKRDIANELRAEIDRRNMINSIREMRQGKNTAKLSKELYSALINSPLRKVQNAIGEGLNNLPLCCGRKSDIKSSVVQYAKPQNEEGNYLAPIDMNHPEPEVPLNETVQPKSGPSRLDIELNDRGIVVPEGMSNIEKQRLIIENNLGYEIKPTKAYSKTFNIEKSKLDYETAPRTRSVRASVSEIPAFRQPKNFEEEIAVDWFGQAVWDKLNRRQRNDIIEDIKLELALRPKYIGEKEKKREKRVSLGMKTAKKLLRNLKINPQQREKKTQKK